VLLTWNLEQELLKVTPAHDFNDAEMAQRHNLPYVCVIDEEGKMTDEAGQYKALDRYEARKKLSMILPKLGFLIRLKNINIQ